MMGPHWNQNYAEIAIGLHGKGMVLVVCPTISNETLCEDQRFQVEEGDVFVVPRYHPMSQISYNNGSFVFVGFTMTSEKNHPRYLAGKPSILHFLDKIVLGKSLNANKTIVDQIYSAQRASFIFECTSCAEEEERVMEEEEEVGRGREREGRGRGRKEMKREGETTRKEKGKKGEGRGGSGRQEKRREKEKKEAGKEGEGRGGSGRQEKEREGETTRKEKKEEEMEREGEVERGWGRHGKKGKGEVKKRELKEK